MDLLFLERLNSVLTPILGDDVVELLLRILLERWFSVVHLLQELLSVLEVGGCGTLLGQTDECTGEGGGSRDFGWGCCLEQVFNVAGIDIAKVVFFNAKE